MRKEFFQQIFQQFQNIGCFVLFIRFQKNNFEYKIIKQQIKMFLGLPGGRDRDQNMGTCWGQLEMGFKILFIISIAGCLLSLVLSGLFVLFPNVVVLTVEYFQIWRLFTSFLWPGDGFLSFINVLFNFYMLYMFIPDMEKKLSTAYILLEVLIQIFLCNVALTIVGYPLYYLKLGDAYTFIGYGMLPAVFIFIWHKIAENPDEATRFCFFPCLIPMKYIPVCFVLLFAIFGSPIFPLIVYLLLGYYQYMVRKKSIIRLPLKVYRKFDSLMPDSLKQKPGYIKVADAEQQLRKVCLDSCCNWENHEENNPFREHAQPVAEKAHVQVMGGGVAIGGSSANYRNPQMNFRDYWLDKEEQKEKEEQKKKKQQEKQKKDIQNVAPGPELESDQQFQEYSNQGKPKKKPVNMNDTMMSEKPLKEGSDEI